jgi:hypothetical protein
MGHNLFKLSVQRLLETMKQRKTSDRSGSMQQALASTTENSQFYGQNISVSVQLSLRSGQKPVLN